MPALGISALIWRIQYVRFVTAMMSAFPSRENRLTPVSADGVYIRVGGLMYRHCQDAVVTTVRCAMLLAGASLLRSSFATAAEPPALKLAHTVPLPHVKGGFDLMAADVAHIYTANDE